MIGKTNTEEYNAFHNIFIDKTTPRKLVDFLIYKIICFNGVYSFKNAKIVTLNCNYYNFETKQCIKIPLLKFRQLFRSNNKKFFEILRKP